MTRGKKPLAANRFQAAAKPPYSVGDLRDLQRAEVVHLNDHGVYLPNPDHRPPIQKNAKSSYRKNVGLQRSPDHFYELEHGDAGAAQSVYRRVELFQQLAPQGERVAASPLVTAQAIATQRSKDNRPRYWQANLFAIARTFFSEAPVEPLSQDEVLRFNAGIPPGTPSITGNTAFGIPSIGNVQFRVMVFDESGQRFFDVDVLGTRGINAYAWGITVFALSTQNSYIIDRQNQTPGVNPPLSGLLEQSLIGARIIPIRVNNTRSVENRSVSVVTPGGQNTTVIPIPPGAKRAQLYSLDGTAVLADYEWEFEKIDPLNPDAAANGSLGTIDFFPASASPIYDVPNANAIVGRSIAADSPSALWNAVFEVTP